MDLKHVLKIEDRGSHFLVHHKHNGAFPVIKSMLSPAAHSEIEKFCRGGMAMPVQKFFDNPQPVQPVLKEFVPTPDPAAEAPAQVPDSNPYSDYAKALSQAQTDNAAATAGSQPTPQTVANTSDTSQQSSIDANAAAVDQQTADANAAAANTLTSTPGDVPAPKTTLDILQDKLDQETNSINATSKGGVASNPMLKDILKDSTKAVGAEQEAQQTAANTMNDIVSKVPAALKDLADKRVAWYNDRQAHTQQLQDDYATGAIDPEHMWKTRDAYQKASLGIGLVLGGFAQAFTGKNNPAQDMIQRAIENDIHSQEVNLNKKGNTLKYYVDQTHDMEAAKALLTQDYITNVNAQLNKATAGLNAAVVGPKADILRQNLKQAYVDNNAAYIAKMTDIAAKQAATSLVPLQKQGLIINQKNELQGLRRATMLNDIIQKKLGSGDVAGIGEALQTAGDVNDPDKHFTTIKIHQLDPKTGFPANNPDGSPSYIDKEIEVHDADKANDAETAYENSKDTLAEGRRLSAQLKANKSLQFDPKFRQAVESWGNETREGAAQAFEGNKRYNEAVDQAQGNAIPPATAWMNFLFGTSDSAYATLDKIAEDRRSKAVGKQMRHAAGPKFWRTGQ